MDRKSAWIRKHMLESSSSDDSNEERQLSEEEKRVLRSIEKLSIPDWYLNNNSRPPRILLNGTPIDQRPAAWKNVSAKTSPETSVVEPNDSTVCLNGDLETKIESGSDGEENNVTDKTNRNSPTKKSPVKQKNKNLDGSAGKLRLTNISQTFPRVAPSRKIQNINIVFPQEMADTRRLMITDLDDLPDTSVNDMTVDSLEVEKEEKDEIDDTEPRDSQGENSPQETVSIREESDDVIIAGSILQDRLRETKRRSSVFLFLRKKSSPVEIPKPTKNDNESQKSQLPVHSPDSTKKSPVDDSTGAKISEKGSEKKAAPPANKSGGVKRKSCGCSDTTPARQPLGSGPRVSSFRPRTVLPPIPESEFPHLPERQEVHPNVCPTRPPFNSPVETAQPIEIEDDDRSSILQTSLASAIIKELNERCSGKSKAAASAKKFVKKLVAALENESRQASLEVEKNPCEESTGYNAKETFLHDETFIFGENSSEDENNSVAMSTSISLEGSDSSIESTPESLMIENDIYDWNSEPTHPNDELPKDRNGNQVVNNNSEESDASDDDDEWMYWHQNSAWNYPRTSSRLSSVSSLSDDYSDPCMSPIDQSSDLDEVCSTRSGTSSSCWDTIYKTKKSDVDLKDTIYKTRTSEFDRGDSIYKTKNLFTRGKWRLDDANNIVWDSGYSDISSSSSSSSYTNETTSWNYTGTTDTASENCSYYNDDSFERTRYPLQKED